MNIIENVNIGRKRMNICFCSYIVMILEPWNWIFERLFSIFEFSKGESIQILDFGTPFLKIGRGRKWRKMMTSIEYQVFEYKMFIRWNIIMSSISDYKTSKWGVYFYEILWIQWGAVLFWNDRNWQSDDEKWDFGRRIQILMYL